MARPTQKPQGHPAAMSRTQLLVPWAPFWGLLSLDIGMGTGKRQLGSDHRPVTGMGLCGLYQQPGQGLGPLDAYSGPAFSATGH